MGTPDTTGAGPGALGFDVEALRDRYRIEHDKRLRADGNEQYLETSGRLARFGEDPHADPGLTRPALDDEVDVVVLGGGFGGLLVGAKLRDAGVPRIRVIEKGGDFGGTWYWNRYPGAQCDIDAYIYLPLLEELGYMPTQKYVYGPEILAHAKAIATRYRLYDDACFQTEVTGIDWDEEAAVWVVRTDRGDRIRARFVAMSSGPLSKPKLPALPGIEDFGGHMFHTSRWDYAYTGGNEQGGLDRLADKRVAVVGTGATGVQVVPHLGAAAQHLYVVQRTPSSIDERNNRPTDPEWARSLEPGWQERRMMNFTALMTGAPQAEDLVGDNWTDLTHRVPRFLPHREDFAFTPEDITLAAELANFQKMEEIRARVGATVTDPATAESLKPYYRLFCKRPCFNDDYLPTFNRPNVTLLDTDGRGIERMTSGGVVVGGIEHAIDCLIFATGFEVGTAYTRRQGYDVVGRGGVRLSDEFADGMRTFHGLYAHGFPNLFFMGVTQTGVTHNFPHLLKEQAQQIAYVIERCRRDEVEYVEATAEAVESWGATMAEHAHIMRDAFAGCTPSYYDNEGRADAPTSLLAGIYGPGPVAFFELLREWRDASALQGLERRSVTACGPSGPPLR